MTLTPGEIAALGLSLKVALCCMAVVLLPGIACGWLLARKAFVGKAVIDALIHLPLVLPPVVPGYLLLVLLGRQGVVGRYLYDAFGITVAFTWQGAVIASAVMALPLMVRAVRLAIELVDRRVEQAAATLGAGPWYVFATVTLPLALPGIMAGMILAFSRSLGEFGATITFVGNIPHETQTLPLAIYAVIQQPGGDAAALRLAALSVALALAALVASEWLARRAQRRLGR